MSYRVVPFKGGWIAQREVDWVVFTFWRNMFITELSKKPYVFSTKRSAVKEVVEWDAVNRIAQEVLAPHPVTFFVDNYGKAHETADYER